MFKCRECGCEYKEKPDYCDCGNNTFDEILPQKKLTLPDLRQIISILIFVLCLILAIIPWTIKDKPQTQTISEKKVQPAAVENIPDIEAIWNDKISQPKKPAVIPEPAPVETTSQPAPNTAQPKQLQIPAPVVKKQAPVQKKITQQPAQTQKPQTQKTTVKPVQKQTQPTQTKPPSVVEKVAQQVSKPQQNSKTTQQTQKQTSQQKPKQIDQTPLINYKNELRIALLAKLNVPNVNGTGDCAVSFSIDTATGKLLNRNFIYKSNNKSVNDEVYYMLMRLPYFKKPPSIYKGETIKLKFYFNNGYYEISFI